MYSSDVFAVLTAKNLKASSPFHLPHNATWFRPAVPSEEATIGSREPTPALDAQEGDKEAGEYSIAVDEELRIWLHDRRSTHGTAVEYDMQNAGKRRVHETWLLASKPGSCNSRLPRITIDSGGIRIGIEFPNHGAHEPQYCRNLWKLVNKAKEDEALSLQSLGLVNSVTTPSETQAASNRLLYYRELEIGSGALGRVFRAIRLHDGKCFAVKVFGTGSQKRRHGDLEPTWLASLRREYTFLTENPHSNLIQVTELRETHEVSLIMPYFVHGSMANALRLGVSYAMTAVGQILDCLTFLHGHGVTHGNLKPTNVLIQRDPRFKVVLTDFAMPEVVTDLSRLPTLDGTLKYRAPEVFHFNDVGYGPPADVWSLGVMALEWLHEIPAPPPSPAQDSSSPSEWRNWSQIWADWLITHLHGQTKAPDAGLLEAMLVTEPAERLTAQKCLMKGFKNGLFKRRLIDGLVIDASDWDPAQEEELEADLVVDEGDLE